MSAVEKFLAESAAIEAEATEGPWLPPTQDHAGVPATCSMRPRLTGPVSRTLAAADAEFIAHARTALPKYERVVRELMAEVRDKHEEHRRACNHYTCDECENGTLAAVEKRWADADLPQV